MGRFSPTVRLSGQHPGAAFLSSAFKEFEDFPFREADLEQERLKNQALEDEIARAVRGDIAGGFIPGGEATQEPTQAGLSTAQPVTPEQRLIQSGGTDQRFRSFREEIEGSMGRPDTGLPTLQDRGRTQLPVPGDVTQAVAEELGMPVEELTGTIAEVRNRTFDVPGGQQSVFSQFERAQGEIEEIEAVQELERAQAEHQRRIRLQIAGDPGTTTETDAAFRLEGLEQAFDGHATQRAQEERELEIQRQEQINIRGSKFPPPGRGSGAGAGGPTSLKRDANNETARRIVAGEDPFEAATAVTLEKGTAPDMNAVNRIVNTLTDTDKELVSFYGLPDPTKDHQVTAFDLLKREVEPSRILALAVQGGNLSEEDVADLRVYLNGKGVKKAVGDDDLSEENAFRELLGLPPVEGP